MAVVRTSDDARDLLNAFADRHGLAVTSLLEAFARRLPVSDDLSPFFQEIVSEARAIFSEGKSRGG